MAEIIDRGFAESGFDGAMLNLGAELEVLAEQQCIQGVFIAMPYAMADDVDNEGLIPFVRTVSRGADLP